MQDNKKAKAPDIVRAAAAHVAIAHRTAKGGKGGDRAAVAAAELNLKAARLERAIRRAVSEAPPLSGEQRARLAAILGGSAR